MKITSSSTAEEAMEELKRERAEARQTVYLTRIQNSPADDEEIECYARGVVIGYMRAATPNVVGSLLARIAALQTENAALKNHIADVNQDFASSLAHCDQFHIDGREV